MNEMIIIVFLCIVVPISLLCGLLEKRSRNIVLSVITGCTACLFAAYLNTWICDITKCSDYYRTTSIAPFVEEILKFIPIFIFSKRVSTKKQYLLSIAFAVGMGFTIIENAFMLLTSLKNATVMWIITRGIGAGLMHGISTSIVGLGIYIGSKDKRILFTGTLATLFLAMMYHGAYNAMIQTEIIKYFGVFVPFLSYIIILFVLNKNKIDLLIKDTEETKNE